MKIHWYSRAENSRDQVGDYIREQFGSRRMNKFLHSVERTVKMLKRHPEIGPIDPLFADRATTYRSVVVDGLSKMVYRYDEDEKTIHIVAFWDCRREPELQAEKMGNEK